LTWMPTFTRTLVLIDPLWNALAFIAFMCMGMSKRFPAMRNLLFLRTLSAIVLTLLLNAHYFISLSPSIQFRTYFYLYWVLYLVGAIVTFFVLQEIFTYVLEPVPGLRKLGLIAFRWVSIISVIVSAGTASFPFIANSNMVLLRLSLFTRLVMRCTSILELCLLAFLVLSIHSLGRSFGSKVFGMCLGLGMEATMLMIGVAIPAQSGIYTTINFFVELVGMIVCLIWVAYFVLPKAEPDHVSVALPVTSPLLRWNEIAKALGHSTPHVAVGTSGGFFLQDVEKVVDKVMTKNALTTTK